MKKRYNGKRNKKRFWHYTVGKHGGQILLQRLIKASPIYVDGEIPAVWVSINQDWEQTVRKDRPPLSRDDLFDLGHSPVRFEINPELVSLVPYKRFKKESGLTQFISDCYESAAVKWGADPNEWYVSYAPIPLSCCILPTQYWNGSKWLDQNDISLTDGKETYLVPLDAFLSAKIDRTGDMAMMKISNARRAQNISNG